MRKNIYTFPIFLALVLLPISAQQLTAQNQSEQKAVKEWITANKNEITLISNKEYQQLSPALKQLVDADPKTLRYQVTVTAKDIANFEAKSKVSKNYASLSTSHKKDSPQLSHNEIALQNEAIKEAKEVEKWLKTEGKHLRVISYNDYQQLSAAERNNDKLLVFRGPRPTLKDIKAYKATH